MKFDVITLFPEMFSAIKDEGIIARALKKSIIEINTWQLRDFTANKYKNVDDKPYGGGSGMVMQVEPIRNCIKEIKKKNSDTKVIYLSPQGQKLEQKLVEELAKTEKFTEEEAKNFIRKMARDSSIYESKPGHYNIV